MASFGWSLNDPEGRRRRYQIVRRLYRPFVSRYVALSHHLEEYLERKVGDAARASRTSATEWT